MEDKVDSQYDNIEEELKEEADLKNKTHKVSGKSVFRLQEIIKNKAGDEEIDAKENFPQAPQN